MSLKDDQIPSTNNPSLAVTISGFEGKSALLTTSDGQTIHFPIKDLPINSEVGTAFRLMLTTESDRAAEQEKIAKAVLNQILKNQ